MKFEVENMNDVYAFKSPLFARLQKEDLGMKLRGFLFRSVIRLGLPRCLLFRFNLVSCFEAEYQKLCGQAQSQQQAIREDPSYRPRRDLSGLSRKLLDFWGMHFRVDPLELSDSQKAILAAFSGRYAEARCNYHCNRILEDLKLPSGYEPSIMQSKELWLAYYLSEIVMLIKLGLFRVDYFRKELVIHPTAPLKDRLKGYYLNEIAEFQSAFADQYMLAKLGLSIKARSGIHEDELEHAVDVILDKTFAIHAAFVPEKVARSNEYVFFRDLVRLGCMAESAITAGGSLSRKNLLQMGILQTKTLDFIDSYLAETGKKAFHSLDGFLYKDGDRYHRGELEFKYGFRLFVGTLLKRYEAIEKGSDFMSWIGTFFEKAYVLEYLAGMKDYGYRVFGEFKAETNGKLQGYDIDIVLHDVEPNLYYFIQAKYWVQDLPTYLWEQFELFNRGKIQNGMQQLLRLKENMDEASIRQKLDKAGLSGALANNSHFILLHNIPSLNFYESSGVLFYEWNLFRNILKKGRMTLQTGDEIVSFDLGERFKLHDHRAIIDAYLEESFDINNQQGWHMFSKAWTHFQVNGMNVTCKLF